MSCNGERQANMHAARVALDRNVDETADPRELDNLVKLGRDFTAAHPEERSVQVDVVAPAELGVKARTDFEQRPHATLDGGGAFGRFGDPSEDLQQRRLSRPIGPDHSEDVTMLELE
jgi:hypothetical protein